MIQFLGAELDVPLIPATLRGEGLPRLQVDGVCLEPPVLCEVYAHQGALKGSGWHKVIADAAKLVLARRIALPNARLILLLSDAAAEKSLASSAWRSAFFREFGIEVMHAELSPATKARVRAAQGRQRR
ncbi:MAG: hypothetical protein QOK05_529 [Chloroflexota bacterium]|nr:hypothetical protein [Chloroflexota bacterium]